MKTSEALQLLTEISKNDGREVTIAAGEALALALPDVTLADALVVLPRYYRAASRESKTWIYPGDILFMVRDLYRQRAGDVFDAAYAKAIEGLSEDDDHVRDTAGGLRFIGGRAGAEAKREWLRKNPMPGEDVKLEERKHLERAGRYEQNGMGGRNLIELPPTPTADSWAAVLHDAELDQIDAG